MQQQMWIRPVIMEQLLLPWAEFAKPFVAPGAGYPSDGHAMYPGECPQRDPLRGRTVGPGAEAGMRPGRWTARCQPW
jgi:hypothetical protein